jgi:hypothetical protein
MPPRRCVAQARGSVSSWEANQPRSKKRGDNTNRISAKDAHNFIPFRCLIRAPSKLIGKPTRKVLHSLLDLRGRVGQTGYTTSEEGPRQGKRVAAILVLENKVGDGDGVGRGKWELRDPGRGIKHHSAGLPDCPLISHMKDAGRTGGKAGDVGAGRQYLYEGTKRGELTISS